jgi:hypothetical protein
MSSETVNSLVVRVTVQGTVVSSNGAQQNVDYTYEQVFQDGTGNNQVQWISAQYGSGARPLNATNETIDLDGVTDQFGVSGSDRVGLKLLLARFRDTTASATMSVGGGDFAGSTGPLLDSTDVVRTGPDGLFLWISPRDSATIASTADDGLKVALSTNSSYDLILAGDNT